MSIVSNSSYGLLLEFTCNKFGSCKVILRCRCSCNEEERKKERKKQCGIGLPFIHCTYRKLKETFIPGASRMEALQSANTGWQKVV